MAAFRGRKEISSPTLPLNIYHHSCFQAIPDVVAADYLSHVCLVDQNFSVAYRGWVAGKQTGLRWVGLFPDLQNWYKCIHVAVLSLYIC